MNSHNLRAISQTISESRDIEFMAKRCEPVNGGDINQSYCISQAESAYFVKLNHHSLQDMFAAEAGALEAIKATQSIQVPKVICSGITGDKTFLVLDFVEIKNEGDEYSLGKQIALLHRHPHPTTDAGDAHKGRFGWTKDGFIGSTRQANPWYTEWAEFFKEARLRPQFELAYKHGFSESLKPYEEELFQHFASFFDGYRPHPSLVHGDLWSGNKGFHKNSPIIYDPASYYGDREVDIAMTELFGSFSHAFYQGYTNTWPLDKGYKKRKDLYNLYHLLNHLNLFGQRYLAPCLNTVKGLLVKP